MKGEFRLEGYIVPIQKLHNSEMAIIFSLKPAIYRYFFYYTRIPYFIENIGGKLMYYLLYHEVINGPPASCRLKTRQWRKLTILMPGLLYNVESKLDKLVK